MFNRFLNLRSGDLLTARGENIKSQDEDHKCGLELVNTIAFNIDQFSQEQQLVLRPLLDRPVTDASLITPGGYFKIHYDLSGANALGYNLNQLAIALDSTYKFEIEYLGYNMPPGDSAANPNLTPDEYGGDNLYDVYVENLGSGFYGYTTFEIEIGSESNRFTSYMVIDNDYIGYYSSGINGARVTVAHEFHHAIQGGNYVYRPEDVFFHELTSTSMEEFVFDDVDDYYAYNNSYFKNPETPLPLTTGYNVATWNIFLRDNFDYNIIKRQWELMPVTSAMFAISNSLLERGTTFAHEFNKYGIWMFFTNYRAVPGKYFEEGAFYPEVEPTSIVPFDHSPKQVDMTSKAAAHAFVTFVVPGNNDSLVAIITNGDVQNAVGGLNNTFTLQYTLYADSSSGARFLTENYSSDFVAQNISRWSASEILNNLLVREDEASFLPADVSTFAFPNPFVYGKNISERINISFDGKNGDKVDFNIYSSAMELIFSSQLNVGPLANNSLGVSWNALGNNGEKLQSGVYIYVIKKGNDVFKGKLVILN